MFRTFLKCLKILRNLNFWDLISSLAKTTIAFTCLCVCAPHSKHQTYLTLLLRDRDLTKYIFTKILTNFDTQIFWDQHHLAPKFYLTKRILYINFSQNNFSIKIFGLTFFISSQILILKSALFHQV